MKTRLLLTCLLASITLPALAANVAISGLPIITAPSTNTFIEVADMDAATKSRKYLLTNLVTQSELAWEKSGATDATLVGTASAGTGVFTNGVTAGASIFNMSLTLTNGTAYAILVPDAANTLALRNGANVQGLNIYNTYTDASNYERAFVKWVGNVLAVGMEASGTGNSRSIAFQRNGTTHLTLNGNAQFTVPILFLGDNTYDIGASGASRPRNGYFGTSLTVPLAYIKRTQDGYTNVLTSGAASSLFYAAVANTNSLGGKILYTLHATDGTDTQEITGECKFGAVAKATAVTAQVSDSQTTAAVSAGTLTATVAANVATNNVFALQITPTTSLTTTNLTVKWRLETPGTWTVNPL